MSTTLLLLSLGLVPFPDFSHLKLRVGDDYRIDGGGTPIPPYQFADLTVKSQNGDRVAWKVRPEPAKKALRGDTLTLSSEPGKTYSIEATVINFEAKRFVELTAEVTFAPLVKPVPGPPGPTPVPPGPDPGPSPTPVTGLRVLMLRESAGQMTRAQLNLWASPAVDSWLKSHCVKDEKGRPSYRRWDKDVILTDASPTLVRLWEAVKPKVTTLPVLVVASDLDVKIHPWPDSEASALTLLKSYGGE